MAGFFKGLIMPSNFAVLCSIIGIALLFSQQYRKQSMILLSISGVTLTLFSTGTIACLLLSPLEYEFPALSDPRAHPEIKKIVLLTHYVVDDPLMPLSSRASDSTVYRLLETHRLQLACPKCEVIISGNSDAIPVMRDQLESMTVQKVDISEDGAEDTYVSAENLKKLISNEPFFLVTSAGHMPRSMGVFHKQGMRPVPAPTDYQVPKSVLDADVGPSPKNLYRSGLAINEYAALIWYQFTGKI